MVEGGGHIINSLLLPEHQPNIDMVIVTIAPTWLGQGGVVVSPNRCFNENQKVIPAARLSGAKWYPFGEDVVLCGAMKL
jgi:2,5-diamino-6-(ribosylamino)-4(3H)-pyrimidinone 5'-phosphate reductase